MSRLIDLRRASEAATVRKPSTLVKPLAPGTTKTTLPPFREILPAYHPVARSPPSLSPSRSPEPPLQEYYLPHKRGKDDVIMIPYTMHKPDNEAIHSTTRKTASGKTLTYTLNVKQQPERARACGAGARACADRRPVDPPPIVELRIFEGETTKTDITLSYNANFFLFATLEVARPIANGRTHPSPAIPVLTGCPVAGANYLDRPSPAAYFLFPDLSVRHEGWYRLSFNLYEATKEPEDLDIDRPAQTAGLEVLTPSPAPKTQSSMAWRLEVKSAPFQVYSAKKFPGLSESTEISRIVADQGCRVRIRRDIRMRKRNTDKSEYEAAYEEGMRSATRFTTPDSAFPPQTPTDPFRSASRGSMDASQLGVESYHRASMQESSYNSHGMHSAAPSMSHPSPFSAPPPPLNNAPSGPLPPLGPLAPPYPRAAPVQPPAASNHDFAVPLPPARFIERPPIEQAKPYYPQLPQPAAMPQLAQLAASPQPTAIPQSFPAEVSQPQPHSSMQLPAILTDNEPPRQPGTMYDPARRHWHLPDTGSSSKRSYSPRSDTTQHPLKHGMRPDHVPVASNHKASVIEADSDPYNDDDDDDQYVVQGIHPHGFMEYRRACGKSNRKPVPNLAQ